MFDMMYSGKKISDARKAKNMTKMELADKLNISYQAVSNWERGISMPDISKLPEISELLEISVDEILGKKSAVIENALNEDYKEDVTMEEIIEAAPLMKPEQVNKAVENTKDLSDIESVLPFLSQNFVNDLFIKASNEGNDNAGMFLPFVSTELVDEIAEKLYKAEGINSIGNCLPFMSYDMLKKIADDCRSTNGFSSLTAVAPFLPCDYLNTLAEQEIEKNGIKAIAPLAPFIDNKILEKYIRKEYL